MRRERVGGEGRGNKLESSHEAMQLHVRARALMLAEEIKCPHKGLDPGGLRCFLSRVRRCDNCFSNIRNLSPSKPEPKKEGKKKKEKKRRHQSGRASGQGPSTVRVHVSHSPPASQRRRGTALLGMEQKRSCSVRQKKCHCRGPRMVTCPEGKGHQQ